MVANDPHRQGDVAPELVEAFGPDHLQFSQFNINFTLPDFHSRVQSALHRLNQVNRHRAHIDLDGHFDIIIQSHPQCLFQLIFCVFQ